MLWIRARSELFKSLNGCPSGVDPDITVGYTVVVRQIDGRYAPPSTLGNLQERVSALLVHQFL